MKSQYRYSFLHFSLFVGALILENQLIFFAFAVAAGLVPKFKYRFGYYTFLASLALIGAFLIQPNYGPLIDVFDKVLELRTISLNYLIAIISALTLGLVSRASNELFFLIAPPKITKEEDDDLDEDEEFYET
jgi:uncharacterized membrane protein